jgi:putative endonuclease
LAYYLYLLRSIPTGKFYIGITADVDERLREHNTRNGRWTSAYKPWAVVATEEFPDRSSAAKRERFLKSRAGILARGKLLNGEGKI